jgi:unsaturated rhamnogalacturonyl hydrolase
MPTGATAVPPDLLRKEIHAAAVHALSYPYRRWGFGEGPGLVGLLAAAEVLGHPEFTDAVEELVRPTLDRAPRVEDHLIPVEALVALARQRPRVDVRPAIDRFVGAVVDARRPMPGRPAVHRPDHPELGTTIWVDCLHTDGPGLALAGYPDAAAAQVEEVAAVLQDASGLFSHGYDVATGKPNGVHWGRGQGWALHGLVGLAHRVTEAGRRRLAPRIDALLEALGRYEIDGSWRAVVDDEASPIENSLSPMVAAAVLLGVSDGIVADPWHELADRCLVHALSQLDDGGLVVSAATPVGDVSSYRDRPVGVFPWGQGPLLSALCAALGHTDPVDRPPQEATP